jgi:hypothetical protein
MSLSIFGALNSGLDLDPGLGEQPPMFALDQVQFRLPAQLVTMAVSNNIMLLALEVNRLLRINLQETYDIEGEPSLTKTKQALYSSVNIFPLEIELPRRSSDDRLYKLHFDPTGRHAILTTCNGENYYIFARWKKAKLLTKLRVSLMTQTHHCKV